MISNLQLFTIGNFEFRLQHLLIIGILMIAFTISFMVRSQAADYGFELNEFDPFFNYRATQFIVDNGYLAYFDWHDDRSWHPNGRNVSASSQVMLHITAATLYPIFGGGGDLYGFTILFPVVIGSLSAIIIFALVRVIGGTTAGLFAALFFSLSIPVIIRGTIGWFKSEPLGLFYGLLGIYLLLSGIKSENHKIALAKLVFAGIFLSFGLSSWGGIQFFILPLGLFFLALPFLRNDHKFIIWSIPVFVLSFSLTAVAFERPGIGFLSGIGGFALIGPTIFLIVCIIIQKFSKEEKKLRNGLALLGGTIISGISIIVVNATSQFLPLPSFRYLNAINPFLTTQDPLVDSVAEHSTTTIQQSFYFLSIFMIFAGIGIWLIFRQKSQSKDSASHVPPDMTAFALIIGLIGVYVSSAFVRLELFASISVIILASVGLSIITSEILKNRIHDGKRITRSSGTILKISFVAVIVVLLLIPPSLPGVQGWITGIKAPPTILNGGTNFNIATDDWPAAMLWLKNNTPEDAVVAAWWDYGYWITTLGERISLADNATLSTAKIQMIAKMFLSSPDEGWKLLQELDADYVLVYAASVRITEEREGPIFYLLQGGGDESKKQWFMRIAGEPESRYLHPDGLSGTDYFWENTLLGKMFPYNLIAYANFNSNLQSDVYQPGFTPIYEKGIKFPSDGDGPLRLVYSSPSYDRDTAGPISGVFIYEVNQDYVPNQVQPSTVEITENKDSTIIKTTFGDITIELNENVAPKTVENFKNLVNSGFYDGTIFHRIVPGFVIQGGDPNTISGSRDTWGQGGPGYSINAELSEIRHEKYIVSMARGSDINSAGSQFFIVLDNAPWLDGKYTVFGKVTGGKDIVDKIAALETNSQDQPIEPEKAIIENISIITG